MKEHTEFDVDEFSKAYPDGIENDFWNSARNAVIASYLRQHSLNNILDVGCGRGIVTGYLLKQGFNIKGVELGKAKPIRAGLPVLYNTDAVQLPIEERNAFNVILLLDVIEHIEFPQQFINHLLSHFPGVTHVLITVPARQELWSNYDTYYGHYRRYDIPLMDKTIAEVSLKTVKTQYFFHSLYPLLFLNKKTKGDREIKLKAPQGALKKALHKAMGRFLYMEAKLLPASVYGSSIITLARR